MEWFKAYASWQSALNLLTDEQAGRLMKAIWRYAADGEIDDSITGVEGMAFAMIQPQMQRDAEAHDAFVESRRVNGAKGGRPKKATGFDEEPKKASGFSENLRKPTETYKSNIRDKKEEIRDKKEDIRDKSIERELERETEVKRSRFTPPTIEQVKKYCTDKSLSVDAERFVAYYESNGWRVGRNAMKDWQAAVRTWSRSEFNKTASAQPQKKLVAQQYTQRAYTDSELEAQARAAAARAWAEAE